MRILVLAFALALFAGTAQAQPVALKTHVSIDGDVVTLGDVLADDAFATAPGARALAIAQAPAPGANGTIPIARIRSLAAAQNIALADTGYLETISVTRSSQHIGADVIEPLLIEAFNTRGLNGTLRIRFASEPALDIPIDAKPALTVESLDADPQSGQFRAKLRSAADDRRFAPVTIAGRVYTVSTIPILVRDIKAGEVLGATDLSNKEIPTDKITATLVTAQSDIEGLAARHALRAGEALRQGDLERPQLVRKGSLVSIGVRTAGMILTAQGRALENGGKGDVIRVLNTQSKRTIEATVKGPGEVVVRTTAGLAALR